MATSNDGSGSVGTPAGAQSQTQAQSNSVQITIEGSGDPTLERDIFAKIHSAGRQLGRIGDILDILVTSYENGLTAPPDAAVAGAIAAFRGMRADIAEEIRARSPERFIELLAKLRDEDGKAYAAVRPRLRAWLDANGDTEQAASGPGASDPVPGGGATQ